MMKVEKKKLIKKESKRKPDMNKSELNRNIKWNFKKNNETVKKEK